MCFPAITSGYGTFRTLFKTVDIVYMARDSGLLRRKTIFSCAFLCMFNVLLLLLSCIILMNMFSGNYAR